MALVLPKKDETISEVIEEFTGVYTTQLTVPRTGEKVRVVYNHTPHKIVKNILQFLSKTGYVSMINVGGSGSGKTTWTNWLVHNLHLQKNFVIHWYSRKDVTNLFNILETMQKGVNHIMIFDDASFYLNSLKQEEIDAIESKLTHVRHDVGGEVITIFNIHYSKAIKKFFRNTPFYFLTSLTMDELTNFTDIWRQAKWKLRDFVYYYKDMMMSNGWEMKIDQWTGKSFYYVTDKPMRLGLANELGNTHFFMYYKDSCAYCDIEYKNKKIMDTRSFIDNLIKSNGEKRTVGLLRTYSFVMKGIKAISSRRLSIWNTISGIDRENKLDWVEINKMLDEDQPYKRRRTYIDKDLIKEKIAQLEKDAEIKVKADIQENESFKNDVDEAFESLPDVDFGESDPQN